VPYANGQLQMVRTPVDYDGILAESKASLRLSRTCNQEPFSATSPARRATCRRVDFYQRIIGLELQQYYGDSAAFLSPAAIIITRAQHLGGRGRAAAARQRSRLQNFVVELVNGEELERLVQRAGRRASHLRAAWS